MDRVTPRLWRGVEEPVPSVAEGTSAVLNLPMLLGAFHYRNPRTGFYLVALDGAESKSLS